MEEYHENMLFVFNPNSGKAQLKNSLMKIIQIFSNADYEVTVYPTKAALDGYEKIKASKGLYDIIVCSGGDGTLNEVVSAVITYGDEKYLLGTFQVVQRMILLRVLAYLQIR